MLDCPRTQSGRWVHQPTCLCRPRLPNAPRFLLLSPMSAALADHYGLRQHLADGGFAKLADITALAQAVVEIFVPVPTPRNAGRDRYAPLPGDPPEVAAWRERMNTDDAKALYTERASTVECANAQARNHGLTRFLV